MTKPTSLSVFLLFTLTLTIVPTNHASFSRPISKAEVGLNEEQQTHLTFYWHDVVSGPNPTVAQIATARVTNTSATMFGALSMIDDPLTEGPEDSSKPVGRAQGMYASADLNDVALTMIMNFYFTEGEHNGSTLSVLGRNQVQTSVREMPVVGGTGNFRFAKGYAQAKTQTFDQKTGNAVVKYDVYVSHADSSSAMGPSSDSGSVSGSGSGSGSGSPGSKSSAAGLGQVSLSTIGSLLIMICCVLLS